jgi:hypothetical protein
MPRATLLTKKRDSIPTLPPIARMDGKKGVRARIGKSPNPFGQRCSDAKITQTRFQRRSLGLGCCTSLRVAEPR